MSKAPLRVVGGVLAGAVAHVIARIPTITDHYDVTSEPCDEGGTNALVVGGKTITFPTLRLDLLWPLTRSNDGNRPEPGFPHGRFPYGDKFVSACLARNAAPEHILDLATNGKWGENWPDLDEAFRAESRRLTADDTKHDVKMGAHILKRFRSQRLFWTVDHPTDVLIAELTKRLLAATGLFPDATRLVDDAFTPAETGGVLGIYAVPVHPYVAAHFALAWYRADQTYKVFDRDFTYAQYFEALIEAATRASV